MSRDKSGELTLASLAWRTRRRVRELLPRCLEPIERSLADMRIDGWDLTSPDGNLLVNLRPYRGTYWSLLIPVADDRDLNCAQIIALQERTLGVCADGHVLDSAPLAMEVLRPTRLISHPRLGRVSGSIVAATAYMTSVPLNDLPAEARLQILPLSE